MDPADAGHSVAGGSCCGFDVLDCRGIPSWSHEDSVFPQPLAVVHCFHLVSSEVQDGAGSVALNSRPPASSNWFLYRVRSEVLLENLEGS